MAAVKAKSLPCDGATWQESGLPARTLAALGCRELLYSANSGSMREDVPPGVFLAFTDHINFSGFNPLATSAKEGRGPTPYLSMAELYDAELTAAGLLAAASAGVPLGTGVAGYWMGPSFETPAEIGLAQPAGLLDVLELFSARGHGRLPRRDARRRLHVRLDVVGGDRRADRGRPGRRLRHRHHDDFRALVTAAIPILATSEPRSAAA